MATIKLLRAWQQTDFSRARALRCNALWLVGLGLFSVAAPGLAQTEVSLTQQQVQPLVARGVLDLRGGPDSIYPFVERVVKGSRLQPTGQQFGPWVEVTSINNNVGWVRALEITAANAEKPRFWFAPDTNQQPLTTPVAAMPVATPSSPPPPLEEGLSLGEQRLLQAQTYRAESEEARRFAFQAGLEHVKVVGKFAPPAAVSTALTKETDMGAEVALALLAHTALHRDISLQTYINQLGRWISLESARPDLPWSFAVLDTSAAMVYAIPGGTVLITQGMLAKATSEAELAAILAQAIAHTTEGHWLNALEAATLATPTAGPGNLATSLFAKGLPLDDEIAADRQAVVMLARAGFNPLAIHKAITVTGSNALPKPWVSSLLATFKDADQPTQARLAQVKSFMGARFDAYAITPSVPVATRLTQLTTHTVSVAP